MRATYSPEDNKLRLYADSRLPVETYVRVKNAGFRWAPKQNLFVAPAWTPGREDLLIELAGQIDDENISLAERAEQRSERFDTYSANREADAEGAYKAVNAIASNIPFGQPILVGHHSEARSRRDQEKIHNGMGRAVKAWKTSEYWQRRAAAALAHAEHKELPAVRARRIKTIEAEKRKCEKYRAMAQKSNAAWLADGLTMERAIGIANYDHVSACFALDKYPRQAPASQYEGSMSLWSALSGGIINETQAKDLAVACHNRTIAHYDRWIPHLENRLTYERAMMGEAGGLPSDRTPPEKGGAVKFWNRWAEIQKVNKVTISILHSWGNGQFKRIIPMEKLTEILSPSDWAAMKAGGAKVNDQVTATATP